MNHEIYQNPLNTRYASQEMSYIWSAQHKHSTWRKLWVALAESQRELGLNITQKQIEELKSNVDNIDFELAAEYEKKFRHDVMAHVHTYGDAAPEAKAIIHLGATSCFVTDNSELLQLKESSILIRNRLIRVIDQLARFAEDHKELPCLGFTHLQPAQPTTVGKRASLWCYDLVLDLEEIEHRLETLRFRGVKGTTGTQATFLQLFGGDHEKVEQLDRLVTEKMGFTNRYAVTGQTYSRKVDAQVLSCLSGVAQSAHKMGTDLRILQHRNEIEEPFESHQIGSSAMAYKRNPMRSERMCALARFVMSLTSNAEQTMATQWMERTLDDSANRRLSLPQSFLATDAILLLYQNITKGLIVYPKMIEKHLQEYLPFMATEEILMAGVQSDGDRQELHEQIRFHSQEAAKAFKTSNQPNDLIERLKQDPLFEKVDLEATLDVRRYIGRAPQQVVALIEGKIQSMRDDYSDVLEEQRGSEDELKV